MVYTDNPVTITNLFFFFLNLPNLQIIVTHFVVVCKTVKRESDMSKKKGTKVLSNIMKCVNLIVVLLQSPLSFCVKPKAILLIANCISWDQPPLTVK